jgi:hypothetical protein
MNKRVGSAKLLHVAAKKRDINPLSTTVMKKRVCLLKN